jgi:hypothetical protein
MRFCWVDAIRWLEIKPSMGYEGSAAGLINPDNLMTM